MERDCNRDPFDRRASLKRLASLTAEERQARGSDLVRSCVSEFSGFLLFKKLSRRLAGAGQGDLSRSFSRMARAEARPAGFLNRTVAAEGFVLDLPSLCGQRALPGFPRNWLMYSVYLSE